MWFQPLECSRKKTHNKCKQTNIEKLNVTNVSISLSDREYVNMTSMYMETDENLECCNCAEMVTRKRSQEMHTLSKHSSKILGI